ncbi:MAG: bifunctional riboflavin kinase/FAD synthetase [Steroidobacteraceae bacterium]
MLIRRGFEPCQAEDRGCVVAIGNFDGVHLGHQAILAVLQERGRESKQPTAVVCFEPHPREYFAPANAPGRLMRLRDKVERLAEFGVSQLRVLRFDADLSSWDADTFIERVLVQALGVKRVVIGEGFRFGRSRSGDVAALRRAGAACGFAVDEVASLMIGGNPASSTRVRDALAAGRLDEARAILGRDYRISGRVIAGNRLGHRLGFPTANIPLHRLVRPIAGIFAVRTSGAGLATLPGVASVGTRPTIGGQDWLLEVHLFDFERELYGERLDVDFIARLRDEIHFPDLESLTAQMHEDARMARQVLGG